MSDERPIEEIIGWHRDPSTPDQWCGEHYGASPHPHATVDDLAAWLGQRCNTPTTGWSLHHWTSGAESRFCCHGYDESVTAAEWDTDDYPTILAALTAAVRKVAGP